MAKLPDSKTIKELAELLNDTGLSEIEVETGDLRIRVARQATAVSTTIAAPAPVAAAPAPMAETADTPSPAPTPAAEHPGAVKSPMVGTAYLAPEPGAADFIKVGDQVSAGQTLVIIEAMKTMNPIAAPKAGKIVEIIVANEQPVEFDEVLVVIE
jgi:acetyl-CoA carboxylase biotin carboxyl carrier protein